MQVQVLAADPLHAGPFDGATASARQRRQQTELARRLEVALSVKNVEAALSERRLELAAARHATSSEKDLIDELRLHRGRLRRCGIDLYVITNRLLLTCYY